MGGERFDPGWMPPSTGPGSRIGWPLEGGQGAPGPAGFRTVGVASAEIMPLNPQRRGVLFVNTSANMIYLAKGWAAVIGSFIPLYPNGGFYSEPNERGMLWTGRWFAIASVAGSNLAVNEDW